MWKKLKWDNSFSVGNIKIDEQHKALVALINYAFDACERGVRCDGKKDFINKFYNYATNHFRFEESQMDYKTYPEYFLKVEAHIECSQKILQFHKSLLKTEQCDFYEFLEYISSWFKKHTTGLDKTLLKHFEKRGLLNVKD